MAPELHQQGMLYVVDLHLMKQKNPCTGKVRPAWRRKAEEDQAAGPAGMLTVIDTSVIHYPGELLLSV